MARMLPNKVVWLMEISAVSTNIHAPKFFIGRIGKLLKVCSVVIGAKGVTDARSKRSSSSIRIAITWIQALSSAALDPDFVTVVCVEPLAQ